MNVSMNLPSYSTPSTVKSIDKLLEEWKIYCSLNSRMHNQSRGHFKSLNHGLMIPALILSSVTGIGATSIGTLGVSNNNKCEEVVIDWPLVVIGTMGMISTCLLSVHRLLNAAELQREHDLYSDMFESLANEIDMQLILDDGEVSKMFTNKREFVKHCKSRMDILIDKAPPIPKAIVRKQSKHNCESVCVSIAKSDSALL